MRNIVVDKRIETLMKGFRSLDGREKAHLLGVSRALAFAAGEAAACRETGLGPEGRPARRAGVRLPGRA